MGIRFGEVTKSTEFGVPRRQTLRRRLRLHFGQVAQKSLPQRGGRCFEIQMGSAQRLESTSSTRPSELKSLAVIFRAAAAFGAAVRSFHKIAAQPSGLITE